MRIVHFFVASSAIILSSTELGSQFDLFPNDDLTHDVPRGRSSNSSGRSHLTNIDLNHPPVDYPPPVNTRSRSPPAGPSAYMMLRFPPGRYSAVTIFGFELQEIGLIRLIPNRNISRRFEVRRYTFPASGRIQVHGVGRLSFKPMPTDERFVLTTSTDDVLAIVENNSYLVGIYNYYGRRVGMNMRSGRVFELSSDLANETPLGQRHIISKNFRIVDVNSIQPR